jgi:uncharacterized protein YdeI (YjbR/CyaY-like superfamily)
MKPGSRAAKQGDVKPRFFATPAAFRQWLQKNHDSVSELWVGFRKKATGKASITWPESVDQALCYGWIDGIRKSIDEESYMIRFTPRKRGSVWSAVNTRRAHELIELALMQPAGARAFAGRDEEKTKQYSFERTDVELSQTQQKQFRANRKAWQFWQSQPPSYRKMAKWWVNSAKQEATRERRLTRLIAESEAGRRLGP